MNRQFINRLKLDELGDEDYGPAGAAAVFAFERSLPLSNLSVNPRSGGPAIEQRFAVGMASITDRTQDGRPDGLSHGRCSRENGSRL